MLLASVSNCSCIGGEKFNSCASMSSCFIIVFCVYSVCIIVHIYMKTHTLVIYNCSLCIIVHIYMKTQTLVILFSMVVIFDDSFSMYIVVLVL